MTMDITHDNGTGGNLERPDGESIVVDAPSDFDAAFDTNEFYKVSDVTVARPIEQPYLRDGDIEWHRKPAQELQRAAWTFDNVPLTLDHPESGMVRRVEDIHGFWRNARYDESEDRLIADAYIPSNDEDALAFIEDNHDVSVGFYNNTTDDYQGDLGDLVDNEVDRYQTDIIGNHIAVVDRGRCSAQAGCGLDDQPHGTIAGEGSALTDDALDCGCDGVTTDQPDGIVVNDGTWYAIGPDENADDEYKYNVSTCSDVEDAWGLRGHGDYDISESTLENRIQRAAEAHDCSSMPWKDDETTNDTTTMTDNDSNKFNIEVEVDGTPTIDSLAAEFDAVAELRDERDEYQDALDERRQRLDEAFEQAENFSVEVDEDECRCDAVETLVDDLDEKAAEVETKTEEVEDLRDELEEYRAEEVEERLDTLTDLGADRDEWEDESLDAIEEEIERREEVLDAAPEVSVKDIQSNTDAAGGNDNEGDDDIERNMNGTRTFGRGHGA